MEPNIELDSNGFSAEEYADIKRCLETLLSIQAGSLPLDREFGIDLDEIVGCPVNVARNMLSLEIIEKAERYEPRVKVNSITYKDKPDGQLCPYIHFSKVGEE